MYVQYPGNRTVPGSFLESGTGDSGCVRTAHDLLMGKWRVRRTTARTINKMKKQQKSKKRPHKIETQQRHTKPQVMAASDTEILELAPQHPLAVEAQTEFHAEAHRD